MGHSLTGIPVQATPGFASSQRSARRLYDSVEVTLHGPPALLAGVAEYFWPQEREVAQRPEQIEVELVVGSFTAGSIDALPKHPVTLLASAAGYVPDFNEGIRYTAPWPVDGLICNPHTGSFFITAGRRVTVLNPDPHLGGRDAVRVVKHIAVTHLEADGVVTAHASAFAWGAAAVALPAPAGAGKTTSVLAAVASGARLVSNDLLFVRTVDAVSTVWGWTDPIRIVQPGQEKRRVSLARFFDNDRDQVVDAPVPLAAVVFPRVDPGSSGPRCVAVDPAEGGALLAEHVLPPRRRWLGVDPPPGPRTDPVVHRFFHLTFSFPAAAEAVAMLRQALAADAGGA